MKNLLAILALLSLAACAYNRQYATTTETNPTNGVQRVTIARSTTYAIGDAKTLIERSRASAGKTSSVGVTGLDESSTTTNLPNIISAVTAGAVKGAVEAVAPAKP